MNNKSIVITGITRGLGLALLKEFNKLGFKIYGCGRSKNDIESLRKAYPFHEFEVVDVINHIEVKKWAENILSKISFPDYLINNAALMNKKANLWEIPIDEFSQVIDVNIKGIMHTIKYFVPSMVDNAKGVIINLSSGWGKFTAPQVAPYCATKFAVEGLTQSLAQELPKGMIAVPLSPGIINTDMLKKVFGSSASSYETPDEWAKKAVKFILNLKEKDNGKSLEII